VAEKRRRRTGEKRKSQKCRYSTIWICRAAKKPEPKNDDDESDDESDIDDDDDEVAEDAPGDSQGTDVASNIAKLRGKKGPAKGGRRPGGFTPGRKSPSKPKKAAGKKDSDKWDGPLDMSEAVTSEQMTAHNKKQSTTVLPRGGGKNLGTYGSGASTSSKAGGGVFSYFNSLTGTAEITEETIAPVLEKMRFHLSGKNVAAEIAEKICGAVGESLLGTTKGTFQSISTVVEETVHASLTNILTPKRRIDILRDAMACKGKRPYTVVFCGVNGVGKSTNLAKICYWLLQNDLSVCIAACDTFRAGAIDQLATHCQKLNAAQEESGNEAEVLLYQSGYGKDAANVAHDAIQHAGREGYDVVLVDTAGRMQNNGPLMAALAKLVGINHPDLVLFVGEALVGNEAVDQLSNFNKALADNSYTQTPRRHARRRSGRLSRRFGPLVATSRPPAPYARARRNSPSLPSGRCELRPNEAESRAVGGPHVGSSGGRARGGV